MKKTILTPESPLWSEFTTRLGQGNCNLDLADTVKILKSLPGIDFDETIQLFKEFGGFCDCEILLNVEDGWNVRFKNDGFSS